MDPPHVRRRIRRLWRGMRVLLADCRGQGQVPDLVKFAAIALPILVGLVAVYQYYGKKMGEALPSIKAGVNPNPPGGGSI